jgi:hypothetical protein
MYYKHDQASLVDFRTHFLTIYLSIMEDYYEKLSNTPSNFFGLGLIAISIIISNYDFNIVGDAYSDTSGLESAIESWK